jgi:hypothetical protein
MTTPPVLVPPIVYPQTDEGGYAGAAQQIDVTSPDDGMSVDVEVTGGSPATQDLPGRPGVPLATVIAPLRSAAFFLAQPGSFQPTPSSPVLGPFDRDAWVLDTRADVSRQSLPLPLTLPYPAYWVLEGVDAASLTVTGGVLDGWLDGADGVKAQAHKAARDAEPDDVGTSAADTWRKRLLNGRWGVDVPAGTALGLAAVQNTNPSLRIRALGADGSILPTAAILARFAEADDDLLTNHPVVIGAAVQAEDTPLRMYLRFDVWNVDLASAEDPKGRRTSVQPDDVRLVDTATGVTISEATWSWTGPDAGVLSAPRDSVAGFPLHVEALFPDLAIRLSRSENRVGPAQPFTWSGRGWIAQDGITPGSWDDVDVVQFGTPAQPVTFWLGAKVRLAFAYQQQPRGWYINARAMGPRTTHRVAPGHELHLFRAGTSVDHFLTDDDGEVSGFSFAVAPGDALTVGLQRCINLDAVGAGNAATLSVVDDKASTAPWFTDEFFRAENARVPIRFQVTSGGEMSAADGPLEVVIDAGRRVGSPGFNTAQAAAFHALKYASFTHRAVTKLKGDSQNLPALHEFRFQPASPDVAATGSTTAGTQGPALTFTKVPAGGSWFAPRTVVHEYGHAIVNWLGGVPQSPAQAAVADAATKAIYARLQAETAAPHNEGQVTNSGIALGEGLADFFECLMGMSDRLHDGRTSTLHRLDVPPFHGQDSGWAKFHYGVTQPQPDGSQKSVSLSLDSGRRVEIVLPLALFDYLRSVTQFPGFLVEAADSRDRSKPPQTLLDEWLRTLPPAQQATVPAQLGRLFRWLLTDAVTAVIGAPTSDWTGMWPPTTGSPYPTVLDYLTQLEKADPGGKDAPPESFQTFFTVGVLPWNLEPFDRTEPTPPVLAPDPPDVAGTKVWGV